MNIEELEQKFRVRANVHADIKHFDFGSLSLININRQKEYPIVIMNVPASNIDGFNKNDNEPTYEDYEITFHVFKIWNKEVKKTISQSAIYKKIESIGDSYLRDVLQQGGNEYYLSAGKRVRKLRGEFQQVGVDPVIGVSYTFNMKVHNCL
jgi:hypothetical protein